MGRWLSIAAAVVALGVLGVVVVGQMGGSDDSSSSDMAISEEARDTDQEFSADAASEAPQSANPPSTEAASETADMGVEMAGDSAVDTTAATTTTASASAATTGSDGATTNDSILITDPATPFSTPDELAVIGSLLTAQRDLQQLPPTPEFACEPVDPTTGELIEVLAYGAFNSPTGEIEVLVGVIDDRVFALDPDSCNVLLRA